MKLKHVHTGHIIEVREAHYNQIRLTGDFNYEPVIESKPQPSKKKAVKKKSARKKVLTKHDVSRSSKRSTKKT